MTNWYFYHENNDKSGPISSSELNKLVEQKNIIAETKLENSNGQSIAAGHIKELMISKTNDQEEEVKQLTQNTALENNPIVHLIASQESMRSESNSNVSKENVAVQKTQKWTNIISQNVKPRVADRDRNKHHQLHGLLRSNLVSCFVCIIVIGMIGFMVSCKNEKPHNETSRNKTTHNANADSSSKNDILIAWLRHVAPYEPQPVAFKLIEMADMLDAGMSIDDIEDQYHAMIYLGHMIGMRAVMYQHDGDYATAQKLLTSADSEFPPMMRPFFRAGLKIGVGIMQAELDRIQKEKQYKK